MSRTNNSNPLLAFFSLLLIFSSCNSTIKQGFEHLDAGRLDEARTAFQQDADHPKYRSAAKLGLTNVDLLEKENATLDDLYGFAERLDAAEDEYKKSGLKAQKSLRKSANFTRKNFDVLGDEVQAKVFEEVKIADRPLALDSFLVKYRRPERKIRKKVDTLATTIFDNKIRRSSDYVFYLENIQSGKLKPKLQLAAIDYVREQNKLLELDTFLTHFPIESFQDTNVQKNFRDMRYELVEQATFIASEYATLTSLFHNHQEIVFQVLEDQQIPNYHRVLLGRVIDAFLREYELEKLQRFLDDHPEHYVSKDCWSDELVEAAEQGEIEPLLLFLNDYKFSILDEIVIDEIIQRNRNGKIKEAEKQGWSAAARKQFDAILLAIDLKRQIFAGTFGMGSLSGLERYFQAVAPSPRSFTLLLDVVNKFWKNKNWPAIRETVARSKQYFPDDESPCNVVFEWFHHKQDWFGTVEELMARPDEPLRFEPFEPAAQKYVGERAPLIALDERTFWYSHNRQGKKFESAFSLSRQEDGEWSDISGYVPGVPVSISPNGKQVTVKRADDIAWLALQADGWRPFQKLPKHIKSSFEYIDKVTLSADGQVMILSASKKKRDMYSWIDTDLFVCRKKGGGWGAVIPLRQLNSEKEEHAPFLHADGKTLYFSSNSFTTTVGESDVFVTRRLDDTWANWSDPVNLGKEVNSPQTNWGRQYQVTLGGMAYVEHANDIYVSELPNIAMPGEVELISLNTKTNDETTPRMTILVKDPEGEKVIHKLTNLPNNQTAFIMPDSTPVNVHIFGKGIFPVVKEVPASNPTSSEIRDVDVAIVTIRSMLDDGVPVPLQNGNFEYDKSDLNSALNSELNLISELVKEQTWLIEIAGHTDNVGGEEHNAELSENRALAVRDYLVQQGIASERMTVVGYGATQPLASNDTDAGRALNRRIEIRLSREKMEGGE